ncbi:unnamed protein product [Rotaria socialis]|uniref:Uncharacterized protein n=1 Tax=Rotaria socialis TaxID=392032 RepID=A0A818PAW4_9BILA|nr:unnamed protein product [Rotaria socialis]CAF3618274.1 unnamed protein product [Rotaria socialis]CAF3643774.1 unnamed protein product [Rotaria socialis]CAF4190063.1 unnamed protein product [Rotaria socialis]CAF4336493.1 unnamed protein product [Rotaria socialis]
MSTALTRFYDSKKKRTIWMPTKLIGDLKPRIVRMNIEKTFTTLKMAPQWFKHEDYTNALENIVYPPDIQDHRPFDTIARYRTAIKQNNIDFHQASLRAAEDDTETLVIALDRFAQTYGGELSFTNQELLFNNTAESTACGVANLSSVHLLAADYISTANFAFQVYLNYDTDLARSSDTMQTFVLDFSTAIAQDLSCQRDYVRIFSIEKVAERKGETIVKFGITTPERVTTELLAKDLQTRARKGFRDNHVLSSVKQDDYECRWMPLISFLQLRPADLDTTFNTDYRKPNFPGEDRRGGYPYYLPLGWYRHALKVADKYPNDTRWLGCENIEGEWPVAFHGTKDHAALGIVEKGLQPMYTTTDRMLPEAIQQKGPAMDKRGIYVATHCDGGAASYATPFSVESSRQKKETFRLVFQCRVRPDSFTIHSLPVDQGQAWRAVDADDIRPYGILIKTEKTQTSQNEHFN